MKKHYVLYRHFDLNSNLLYIGKSEWFMQRMAQHSVSSIWFLDIKTVTMEFYGSSKSLAYAEREAIKNERPKFNINGNDTSKKQPKIIAQNRPSKAQIYCSRHFGKIKCLSLLADETKLSILAINEVLNFNVKPINKADVKIKDFINSSLAKYFVVTKDSVELLHDIEDNEVKIRYGLNRLNESKLIKAGLVDVKEGFLCLSDLYKRKAIAWDTNGELKPDSKGK